MKLKRKFWLGVGTVLFVGGAILMATPAGWTLLGIAALGTGAGVTGHQLHDVEMEHRAEIRAHHDAQEEEYERRKALREAASDDPSTPSFEDDPLAGVIGPATPEPEVEPEILIEAQSPGDAERVGANEVVPDLQPVSTTGPPSSTQDAKPATVGIMGGLGF